MNFFLVDSGWDKQLDNALSADGSAIRIVCPFIQKGAVGRLLKHGKPEVVQVVTRFNLDDLYEGVSDIGALELLLENGAYIRGVKNLHAKLYLFGSSRVIVTSANLTDAALRRNHEFGFVAEDPDIVHGCKQYFDNLWSHAGRDLSPRQLADWKARIVNRKAAQEGRRDRPGLGDEGVYVEGFTEPAALTGVASGAEQGFVKFFGEGGNREDRSTTVLTQVERSGCHWACSYPKRPRTVRDEAIIFMGRLVDHPHDTLIYGRAVGMRHKDGRDDATKADIQIRPWKKHWPFYVRVHNAEFVNGSLSNGVSLSELMDALGSNAFASTRRNAARGAGNTDPRKAFMQQAAVELSPEGIAWMGESLERKFAQHGKLASAAVAKLDWPIHVRSVKERVGK